MSYEDEIPVQDIDPNDLRPADDNTTRKQTSSTIHLNTAQVGKLLQKYGYFPTPKIIAQTALNMKSVISGGKKGQGIHAICLDGPPGAGKSFYAKTYYKIMEDILGIDIEFISYQCTSATGKSELYEEISIPAAITNDADNSIIPGVLVKAINAVNSGKIVLLFLDEFDKSLEETDAFLLGFLQDGEIDTTQKGKICVNEECLKNIQVIIGKNDVRELSGPLSRRLKSIQLDYMAPPILCDTIDAQLPNCDRSIKAAITLLYTEMYKNMENFPFSRLPSCSECMQAVQDAQDLMTMGASEADIVETAILANLIKTESDLELFYDFLKQSPALITWYHKFLNVFTSGTKDTAKTDRLGESFVNMFFPNSYTKATAQAQKILKDAEQVMAQAQRDKADADNAQKDANRMQRQAKAKLQSLEEQETALDELRAQVYELRATAAQHAKEEAEKYLKDERTKLKEMQDEVDKLRASATQDAEKAALQKADEYICEKQKQLNEKEAEIMQAVEEKIAAANLQIAAANEQIDNANYNQTLTDLVAAYEKELISLRETLCKMGIVPEIDNTPTSTNIEGGCNLVVNQNDDAKIQTIKGVTDKSNVFTYSADENWVEIGSLTLEENTNENGLAFNQDVERKFLDALLTISNKGEKICENGTVIYQGKHTNIIVVRYIEHSDGLYKNIYKFYSTTTVIPVQSILNITTFFGNINSTNCGIEINKGKKVLHMELNCFISSQKDQKSTDDCRLEKQKTYLYKLSYQNKRCKTFFDIANFLYRAINCSAKQCSREELAKNEEQAHKEHCILVSDVKQVPRIEEIALEV